MQLIRKFNKGICFVLFIFSVNTHGLFFWRIKGITITNAFQYFLDKTYRKPNKIWVDKGTEFWNRSVQSFLQNNNIEMYSTHNEGKFVAAERFIRTLKNKIYKYMNSVSKNVYIDNLYDIVNKYNNTYQRIIITTMHIMRSLKWSLFM